ncbi:MAG TPA: glycosyltransferase [Arcobacter sp.]|nr:glycosyltransferase [Arcobacter sp.]
MKIVQFLASKGWGGLENIFVSLCNELSKNIDLSVIVLEGSLVKCKLNTGIKVYVLKRNASRMNPLLYMELNKILQDINPSLVHTHGAKASEIFYRLNKTLNLVGIASKHNVRKGKVFNKFSNVIAVSKAVKESIENSNSKIIYNGIPYRKPKKISLANSFNIIAVGSLRKIKGYDKLIKAVSQLTFEYHLTIIGVGEEKSFLETLIKKLSLSSRVSLVGFKSNVNDYLNTCQLQVISSESEGFSLAMAEGIFYAPILLSTRVGVCVEILPEELLCDIQDLTRKITDIYKNQEEYIGHFNDIKQNYKEKLTIKICAIEHNSFYQGLLKEKK